MAQTKWLRWSEKGLRLAARDYLQTAAFRIGSGQDVTEALSSPGFIVDSGKQAFTLGEKAIGAATDTPAMMYAGNAEKYKAKLNRERKNILTNPEERQKFITENGLPQNIDDVTLASAIQDVQQQRRAQTSYTNYLFNLDPNRDWYSMTPAQQDQAAREYSEETKLEAAYKSARADASYGAGFCHAKLLADPRLTNDQVMGILNAYYTGVDQAQSGFIKGSLPGQLIRHLTSGDDNHKIVAAALKDPRAQQDTVQIMRALVQRNMQGAASPDMSDDNGRKVRQFMSTVTRALSQEQLDDIMLHVEEGPNGSPILSGPLADATAQQAIALATNATGGDADIRWKKAYAKAIGTRIGQDEQFRQDYLPMFAEAATNMKTKPAEQEELFDTLSKSLNAPELLKKMSAEELFKLAPYLGSGDGKQKLEALGESGKKFVTDITEAMKTRAWDLIKEDPLHNLPLMTGMWLMSKDWKGLGTALADPMMFWGLTGLLLVGGLLGAGSALFGEEDDEQGKAGKSPKGSADYMSEFDSQNRYGYAGM